MNTKSIAAIILGTVPLLTLLCGQSPALAQVPTATEPGEPAGEWVPVRHLRFADEAVEGARSVPDGSLIHVAGRARQASLIELRRGFETEIVKMIEDL